MIRDLIRKLGPAFAAYLVIGGVSALVEWAVYATLLHVTPAGPYVYLDAVPAFVIATFVNYLLCVRTIYVSKSLSVLGDIAKVYLASLLAFAFNFATLAILTSFFAVDPMVGKIAGTGVAFLVNFAARQFVIFAPGLQQLRLPSRLGRAPRDAVE